MAELIRVNGERREVFPADGSFTVDELHALIGGDFQVVSLLNGRFMYLDEEGKLKDLPFNLTATVMSRGVLADDDIIVGDVVVCDRLEAGYDEDDS